MRSRLLVIILLIAWIGQWVIDVPESWPEPSVAERAMWSPVENLAARVIEPARRRAWWPPRVYARRRRQRQAKPRWPRPRGLKIESEAPAAPPGGEHSVKSDSVFDPQRWGLSMGRRWRGPDVNTTVAWAKWR